MAQQVEFVTKEFMNNKISDGVYAAIIRSIGDMAVNSVQVITENQLKPLKTYLENAKSANYESVLLQDAFAQALQKIQSASHRKGDDHFSILTPHGPQRKGKKCPKKPNPQGKAKPKKKKKKAPLAAKMDKMCNAPR
jgi:hypothetical protein